MKLPSAEEYIQLIDKKAPGDLAMLHNHHFLLGEDGKTYWHSKSRRAIVFKTEYNSRFYAVRFFLDDDHELFRRHQTVENFLDSKSFSWKVPFEFLEDEYYPVTKMDWVNGLSFSQYLDAIIANPAHVTELQLKLIELSHNLESNKIGHGNLNLNHIQVVRQGDEVILKLIDYDSMFIPSFEGKDSLSAGTSSFQHPMRLASDFSETLDRFSFWLFLTALEAFKTDASLWTKASIHGYDKRSQLFFTFRDLALPQQSRAFQTLKKYDNDVLNFYTDKLVSFCNSKTLEVIEAPYLFDKNKIVQNEKPPSPSSAKTYDASFERKEQKQPTFSRVHREKSVSLNTKKEAEEKENVFIHVPSSAVSTTKNLAVKKTKRNWIAAIITLVLLLGFSTAYFISGRNLSYENKTEPPKFSAETVTQVSEQKNMPTTVFTSPNLSRFLSSLYQSYNQRNLASILSNYSDNLSRYYDAGGVTKNKLSGIITNLFIKPAYYKCQPDLGTLHSKSMGDSCILTVDIIETIQKDKRSTTENYSSTLEYTIDTSFNILSERNVE